MSKVPDGMPRFKVLIDNKSGVGNIQVLTPSGENITACLQSAKVDFTAHDVTRLTMVVEFPFIAEKPE